LLGLRQAMHSLQVYDLFGFYNVHLLIKGVFEHTAQNNLLCFFPVDQKNAAKIFHLGYPFNDGRLVGVRRETVYRMNAGSHKDIFMEYLNPPCPVNHVPSQRAFYLVADKDNGIFSIPEAIFKMMKDTFLRYTYPLPAMIMARRSTSLIALDASTSGVQVSNSKIKNLTRYAL